MAAAHAARRVPLEQACMPILDFFRRDRSEEGGETGDTETVRKIVRELHAMDPQRARFVAAFAFILGRVAHADRNIEPSEIARMEEIVRRVSGLPEAQAVLAVEIARAQNELFGGTERFVVTREFKEISTRDERIELLRCLFAVSAADESVSGSEEAEIRQISSELDLEHRDFIAARSAYSKLRDVMRDLPGDPRL
jgi:uncharacterized tellurite resistance protein B-like protein